MNQSYYNTTARVLIRKMFLKMNFQELGLLHHVLSKPADSDPALHADVLQLLTDELSLAHRSFLIDYDEMTVTAYFGNHKPDLSCRTTPSKKLLIYSTWYSGDRYPFLHSDWRAFTFIRCTMNDFGIFLQRRYGLRHATAHLFYEYAEDVGVDANPYPRHSLGSSPDSRGTLP